MRHFDSHGNQTFYRQEMKEISNEGQLYTVYERHSVRDNYDTERRPRGYIEEIPSRSGSDRNNEEGDAEYEVEVEEPMDESPHLSQSPRDGGSYSGGYLSSNTYSDPPPAPRSPANYNPSYNSRYLLLQGFSAAPPPCTMNASLK
ncbi:hypothetical protein TWF173_005269 [Orbilia oligospora]|nr:hypothetical protein TWF173_005269 [Orbilia oligospora]